MSKCTMLPLLNSAFEPGKALETVEKFEDTDVRNIAMAELYYFTGRAKECCEIAEHYLEEETMELRLSACMLYGYANLTLGREEESKRGLCGIQECSDIIMSGNTSKRLQAYCTFAEYVGNVLLHLPVNGEIPLEECGADLPEGLKLFAVYAMAHHAYMNGECWSAYGMCKTALFVAGNTYPISEIYIRCMMAICMIDRKYKQEAQAELMEGWKLAAKDDFIQPFSEHHRLLQGLIEVCIRKNAPDAYKRITEVMSFFSKGWREVHNPEIYKKKKAVMELSPMEFSIAILAGCRWTNKEIAAYMGISVNTVKHYLTDTFCKLDLKKRDELKTYLLD